ncbi:MAG: hypothetical protein LBS72_05880 [Oscillospiraceae bacterium]|jgi:hypothetical protein|nr:hypothetical protein [Oscillospiraceae bacterium]
MIRKPISLLLCLLLMLTGAASFAEETPNPEAFVGKLSDSIMDAAVASGQQLNITVTTGFEDAESYGDEFVQAQALLSAFAYSLSSQISGDMGLSTINYELNGESLLSGGIITSGNDIYFNSSILGEETYKVNLDELFALLMSVASQNLPASAESALTVISDPTIFQPYISAVIDVVLNWSSETFNVVTTSDDAATVEHPEAVTKKTIEISPEQLQSLLDELYSLTMNDEEVLSLIADMFTQTISESASYTLTANDVAQALAVYKDPVNSFFTSFFKPISLTQLYDQSDRLVSAVFSAGIVDKSYGNDSELSYDLSVIYDFSTVEGAAVELLTATLATSDGEGVKFYASTELEPIVPVENAYSQTQRFYVGAELFDEDAASIGAARCEAESVVTTGDMFETDSIEIHIAVDSGFAELTDMVEDGGLAAINITIEQETNLTDSTDTLFETVASERISYLDANGKNIIPDIVTNIVITPAVVGDIEIPEDAMDLLSLTIKDLVNLQGVIDSNLTDIQTKLWMLFAPELVEIEATEPVDATESAPQLSSPDAIPAEEVPEAVPAA